LRLPHPPLLVITDRRQAPAPLEQRAAALFAGGCRWLSLREKDLSAEERTALLGRLIALGKKWGALVMVHEDLDAAAATKAGGIHLPEGASPRMARSRLGEAALIGQSAHSVDEVSRAAAEGADYVTLSPIFMSASKPGYGPALGLAALHRPAPVPVLALGGIEPANLGSCLRAGASGAAVMGGAMRAADPEGYMAKLLAAMARALAGRAVDIDGQGARGKEGMVR